MLAQGSPGKQDGGVALSLSGLCERDLRLPSHGIWRWSNGAIEVAQ